MGCAGSSGRDTLEQPLAGQTPQPQEQDASLKSSDVLIGEKKEETLAKRVVPRLDDYSEVDKLQELIASEDVALLKASYLLKLNDAKGVLPRRQDIPKEAFVGPEMLMRILQELESTRMEGILYEMYFQGLVVISYA